MGQITFWKYYFKSRHSGNLKVLKFGKRASGDKFWKVGKWWRRENQNSISVGQKQLATGRTIIISHSIVIIDGRITHR